MVVVRSLAFNLLFYGWLALCCVISLPLLLLPRRWTVGMVRFWARGVILLLRRVVGLDYRVRGGARPAGSPLIIAAKHQSAWDTIVFLVLLDDPSYVIKRELGWIPFYGWFARKTGMIAVDRGAGAKALRRLIAAAQPVLAAGRPIVIFPQGTRTAPGTRRAYLPGVYALYASTTASLVPVALNSGLFWSRRSFLKRPGTISVEFLPPIAPGLDRRGFMAELESRIETATRALEAVDNMPRN